MPSCHHHLQASVDQGHLIVSSLLMEDPNKDMSSVVATGKFAFFFDSDFDNIALQLLPEQAWKQHDLCEARTRFGKGEAVSVTYSNPINCDQFAPVKDLDNVRDYDHF